MRAWTVAFLCGNLLLSFLTKLPGLYVSIFLFCIALSVLIFVKQRVVRLLVAILLGFAWALLYAQCLLMWQLPKIIEGKDLLVKGAIASLPERKGLGHQFDFVIHKIQHHNNIKVRLHWFGEHPDLLVGDQWQLLIRLKRPHGFANPGGIDYEKVLLTKHIRATGYIRTSVKNHKLSSSHFSQPINRLRQSIHQRFQTILKKSPVLGLIEGLTIGVREHIQVEQWQILRASGTSHLLAISGLHIGLISGFLYACIYFIWRYSEFLSLRYPAAKAAAIIAWFGALLYAALAGFAMPTQRALLMISIVVVNQLLHKRYSPWHVLSAALLLILIYDPLATFSSSFWLSFGAVSCLIYGMSGRLKPSTLWWRLGRTQWVVTLGLLPLTLLFFQQTSLIAFFANSIAIPFVGFLIVPICLLSVMALFISQHWSLMLLQVAEYGLTYLMSYLTWLTHFKSVLWFHAIPHTWIILSGIVGSLLLLAPRGWPARWLGIIFFLPVIYNHSSPVKIGDMRFTLLDVGQGLSAVVETAHHVLVYDTGAKFSPSFDIGHAVLIPFLRYGGHSSLDMLMVSHGDNDHSGGALSLLNQMPVKNILSSVPKLFSNYHAQYCLAGQHWQWDDVEFKVLYPDKKNLKLGNDSSCVLSVTSRRGRILLTGDIEKKAEKAIIDRYPQKTLTSTLLIAPHHGSHTSSSSSFINAVNPKYVLFTTGYRNRYHFPHPSIVKRYNQNHVISFNTAKSGAIQFKLDEKGEGFVITEYRKTHPHFWFYSVIARNEVTKQSPSFREIASSLRSSQ